MAAPLAVNVAVCPAQIVSEFTATVNPDPAVIVTDAVCIHPLALVTVTVYVPEHKVEAVEPVPPEGDHEYVYGAFEPEAVTVAVPSHAHVAFVELVASTNGVKAEQELFIELIHVALSILFAAPGV